MRARLPLLVLLLAGYGAGTGAALAGAPAPYLLAALLLGIVAALALPEPPELPGRAHRLAQALVGVLMGSYLAPGALARVAQDVVPLLLVTGATVLLSLAAAWGLQRTRLLSAPSAALGMAPGGSAAVVAAADDVGADPRTVAFAQYLRVALVATTAPLVVGSLHHARVTPATHPDVDLVAGPASPVALLVLVAVVLAGSAGARRVGLPAAGLIGPMLASGLVTATGLVPAFEPTGCFADLVFVVVGLEVGLRFTRRSLLHVRAVAGPVLLATVVVSVGCAGVAALLAVSLHIPVSDAYLATTPGGINAVLATAAATHADLPLVSSVQSLRLFLVVLMTPPLIRLLSRRLGR